MNQIKVSYTAGGSQALGIVSAQQRLLAAILREPRYLDLVQGQLTADRFIQPQQKELYQAMVRLPPAGGGHQPGHPPGLCQGGGSE